MVQIYGGVIVTAMCCTDMGTYYFTFSDGKYIGL